MKKKEKPAIWLNDGEYAKAVGQLRLQLNGVMAPFRCYGLDAYVPEAIEEIVRLAEAFGMRVRGVDLPIQTRLRLERPTE
jgi:hypothetical protein